MKKTLLIGLVVLLLAGGFSVYWFVIRPTEPDAQNANTPVGTANSTATANVNTPVERTTNTASDISPIPTPFAAWDPGYTTDSSLLRSIPESVDAGLATCGSDEYCLTELAIGFRDPRICERIDPTPGAISLTTPEAYLQRCFQRFGQKYGAYDCVAHSDPYVRDHCYAVFSSSAALDQPIDACEKIVDTTLRTDCQQYRDALAESRAASDEGLADLAEFSMSFCYMNQHPEILQEMPQNDLTSEFFAEASSATFEDQGCDQFSQVQIDGTRDVLVTDADNDGVALIIEKMIESSDTAADTDGDGFNDLVEIMNQYDPNGPGKL